MKRSLFQMKGLPKILKMDFNVNKEFDFKKTEPLKLDLKISHKMERNKEKNEAMVILDIKIFPNGKEEAPFTFNTVAVAEFIWGEGLPEDIATKLLETNAPALILSYVRPLISQVTTYSGQPPFIIPLLDLSKN